MNASFHMHAAHAGPGPVKTRTLAVVGAILLGMLAGCAGPSQVPPVMATRYSLSDTGEVILMDATVRQAVECTGLQVVSREDGRLEVTAGLKNLSHVTLGVEVGAVFKGPAGEDLSDETVWHRLTLDGNNTVVVRFVSKDDRAADFAVRVRTLK